MKLIKMKFILALIFICNIASLQVQLDEGLPFYNTFNDQLLKAKLSFADSKKNVENIYSLKSDEKSRVLILDYVEAHDQLLTICDAAAELLGIYVIVPKSEINNELINTLEKKITIYFIDIRNDIEVLIDSFDFYIESEFYNYKKIEILKSKMLMTLNDIRSIIDQS
tara:strand:- start:1043 stop:1543 length:501 start_codon:yes stop_codon:yes gene_type:complete